jgi:hypothetical protein
VWECVGVGVSFPQCLCVYVLMGACGCMCVHVCAWMCALAVSMYQCNFVLFQPDTLLKMLSMYCILFQTSSAIVERVRNDTAALNSALALDRRPQKQVAHLPQAFPPTTSQIAVSPSRGSRSRPNPSLLFVWIHFGRTSHCKTDRHTCKHVGRHKERHAGR